MTMQPKLFIAVNRADNIFIIKALTLKGNTQEINNKNEYIVSWCLVL